METNYPHIFTSQLLFCVSRAKGKPEEGEQQESLQVQTVPLLCHLCGANITYEIHTNIGIWFQTKDWLGKSLTFGIGKAKQLRDYGHCLLYCLNLGIIPKVLGLPKFLFRISGTHGTKFCYRNGQILGNGPRLSPNPLFAYYMYSYQQMNLKIRVLYTPNNRNASTAVKDIMFSCPAAQITLCDVT